MSTSTSASAAGFGPHRRPQGRSLTVFATTLLLLAGSILPAHAQVVVGTVSEVRVWAFGREAGVRKWDDLFAHQAVRQGQGVKTVPKGAARLYFIDNTELRLGSDAEVTVDKYLYSAPQSLEGMSVSFGKGVMRVITGHMSKPTIRIETPTALIGVRGTDFVVYVLADLTTLVYVLSGTVVVTPKAGGPAKQLRAGESGAVAQGATLIDTENVPPYREDPNLGEPGPEGWSGPAGPDSGGHDDPGGKP